MFGDRPEHWLLAFAEPAVELVSMRINDLSVASQALPINFDHCGKIDDEKTLEISHQNKYNR